jgi:hypothetical protein
MSFRKAQKSGATDSQRIRGVKPWINGQFLASSGNRDLDQILGGGLTLVSNIVIYLLCLSIYIGNDMYHC